MRFLVKFLSEKEVLLPLNIRSFFISFIKKTFESEDKNFYRILFENKKAKPYVFSPFFGKEFEKGKVGKDISFIFSSGDFKVISNFWNGLIILKKKKEDFIEIKNEKFYLRDIKLLPNKKINSGRILLKTIGISVLSNPESSAKNFKEWYIIPERENMEKFNEILRKRTEERIKFIEGIDRKINLKFLFSDNYENSINETIVPHYNGFVRGFRGIFILEGDIEVLQFLYDYGFGVRTGQGFGLLEIVKEL
ncbi:MAG: CRISPR-associated endoribonuclease Cas6 [Candidatus Omnitrophica bacterium]|nr:CRISPR-associated endoribonuclease Cas6 [Candidatus Omnitrophota bacterium]